MLFSLFACKQKQTKDDSIVMNDGTEIPLKPYLEAYSKTLGKSVDTKEFCKCYVPKYYAFLKQHPDKLKLFKEGKPVDLSESDHDELYNPYLDCIAQTASNDTTIKVTFKEDVIMQMKNSMKSDLSGSEIEKTNDINEYCDCIIDGIQKEFTAKEFYRNDYTESDKYKKLTEKCLEITKKK